VDIAPDLTDLDKIRQIVELFSQACPVSPEIERLHELFQRVFNDYYSIEIALEFSLLASRCSDSKAKEIREVLLPAYGMSSPREDSCGQRGAMISCDVNQVHKKYSRKS
jgi:hypothetical protein